MSDQREHDLRGAREDNRHEHAATLRLEALQRQEEHAREAARIRTVAPLVQGPAHAFRTPIPHRYSPLPSGECLDAPGSEDVGGFEGCVV